jgi:hypothetical protein
MVKMWLQFGVVFQLYPIHDEKKAKNQIKVFLSNTMLVGNTLSILVIVTYELACLTALYFVSINRPHMLQAI